VKTQIQSTNKNSKTTDLELLKIPIGLNYFEGFTKSITYIEFRESGEWLV